MFGCSVSRVSGDTVDDTSNDTMDDTIGFLVKILALGWGRSLRKAYEAQTLAGKLEESVCAMAERVGFEPTIPVKVCRISSAVHSTTLPPLRMSGRRGLTRGLSHSER